MVWVVPSERARSTSRHRRRRRIFVRWITAGVAILLASLGGYGFAVAANGGQTSSANEPVVAKILGDAVPVDEPTPEPRCTRNELPLVLLTGSSTIAMWDTSDEDLAPMNTINIGVGSTTLADQLVYLEPIVTKFKPRAIVMYAGANDLANTNDSTALVTKINTYITQLRTELPDTVLYFVSVNVAPSRSANAAAIKRVNEQVQSEVTPGGALQYIETNAALLNPDGTVNTSLFRSDGTHLNDAGYDVFAKVVNDRLIADGYSSPTCTFPDGTVVPAPDLSETTAR